MNEAWTWNLAGATIADLVVVTSNAGYSFQRVAKKTKTSVTLTDGSKWTWGGDRWGLPRDSYISWASQPSAHLVIDEALAKERVEEFNSGVALKRAQREVRDEIADRYSTLTQEQVDVILGALEKGEDAKQDAK